MYQKIPEPASGKRSSHPQAKAIKLLIVQAAKPPQSTSLGTLAKLVAYRKATTPSTPVSQSVGRTNGVPRNTPAKAYQPITLTELDMLLMIQHYPTGY